MIGTFDRVPQAFLELITLPEFTDLVKQKTRLVSGFRVLHHYQRKFLYPGIACVEPD